MRFGCVINIGQVQEVQDAGYDYYELAVGVVKPEQPDSEFEPVKELVGNFEIFPEAWNCLLPGDIKVTGPEVDKYRIERYLRTALYRIEELGGEIVVFGSGGARTVPEGFPMDEAKDQIIEFVTLAGQIAGNHGITIAIEPLCKKECNIINTVKEGVEIVRAVDHPFVKVLADLYHMDEEKESLEDIIEADGDLVHTHTADTGRLYPGSGSYPHAEFFQALKKIGYEERISVECTFNDFSTEVVKALNFLQNMDYETSK